MFKFNFNQNEENNEKESVIKDDILPEKTKESKCIEISSTQYDEIASCLADRSFQMFTSNEIEVGFVNNTKVNENSDSDLISGVYEGGFKIWECTQDLADYLTNESINKFDGKRVCDLGCSSGILGIIALECNASSIHFQDYNDDVLEDFTIPNVILHLEENEKSELFSKCKFYSGDWDKFRELTSSEDKYDVILTSETIYNPQYYSKLINFFKARLSNDGIIYLAAKSHYFGVGGNVVDFCKALDVDGSFSYESVWTSNEGLQRQILSIKWK